VFNLACDQNQSNRHIGSSSPEFLQLKTAFEKEQAINTQKDKEIEYLNEIIGMLKKPE
jgi:hypothetical protein